MDRLTFSTTNKATLLCVYYHNRSKRGNLELLRQWKERRNIQVLLVANKYSEEYLSYIDNYIIVDFSNPLSVLEDVKQFTHTCYHLLGSLPFGEDEVPINNLLCQELGLPGNPLSSGILTRHKYQMRQYLQSLGLPTPRCFKAFTLEQAVQLLEEQFLACGKHAFLKPPLGTGSMHCCEIENSRQLAEKWTDYFTQSWNRARADPLYNVIFGPDQTSYYLLMEDLLGKYSLPYENRLSKAFPVHELSVEGIVNGKEVFVYGYTDKLIPDTRTGREYMWRTSRIPSSMKQILKARVKLVCNSLNLQYGGVHFEFRLEPVNLADADLVIEGQPVRATIIEFASRFDGAYMQTFWFTATGFDPISYLADQACGLHVEAKIYWLHPSIMLNLWPTRDGSLSSIRGVEKVQATYGRLIIGDVIAGLTSDFGLIPSVVPEFQLNWANSTYSS